MLQLNNNEAVKLADVLDQMDTGISTLLFHVDELEQQLDRTEDAEKYRDRVISILFLIDILREKRTLAAKIVDDHDIHTPAVLARHGQVAAARREAGQHG